jgi:hypothetical protein
LKRGYRYRTNVYFLDRMLFAMNQIPSQQAIEFYTDWLIYFCCRLLKVTDYNLASVKSCSKDPYLTYLSDLILMISSRIPSQSFFFCIMIMNSLLSLTLFHVPIQFCSLYDFSFYLFQHKQSLTVPFGDCCFLYLHAKPQCKRIIVFYNYKLNWIHLLQHIRIYKTRSICKTIIH